MKISKFLLIIISFTLLALVYVWQQSEIFLLGYLDQKNVVNFEELLEENTCLRYNINKSISLVELKERLITQADFQMPDTYRLVRLAPSKEDLGESREVPKKSNLFVRLFTVKRQAQAETLER